MKHVSTVAICSVVLGVGAPFLFAQDASIIGKGKTTNSRMEQHNSEGLLTSTTFVEERHIDVRQKVIETFATGEDGALVPKQRVTERVDKYWGAIKITEEPVVKGGDFEIVRVEMTIKDNDGGYVRTILAYDKKVGRLKLQLRTTCEPQGDGRVVLIEEGLNKLGKLVELKREEVASGYNLSEVEAGENRLQKSISAY